MIAEEEYRIVLHVLQTYQIETAELDEKPVKVSRKGELVTLSLVPYRTMSISWSLKFSAEK